MPFDPAAYLATGDGGGTATAEPPPVPTAFDPAKYLATGDGGQATQTIAFDAAKYLATGDGTRAPTTQPRQGVPAEMDAEQRAAANPNGEMVSTLTGMTPTQARQRGEEGAAAGRQAVAEAAPTALRVGGVMAGAIATGGASLAVQALAAGAGAALAEYPAQRLEKASGARQELSLKDAAINTAFGAATPGLGRLAGPLISRLAPGSGGTLRTILTSAGVRGAEGAALTTAQDTAGKIAHGQPVTLAGAGSAAAQGGFWGALLGVTFDEISRAKTVGQIADAFRRQGYQGPASTPELRNWYRSEQARRVAPPLALEPGEARQPDLIPPTEPGTGLNPTDNPIQGAVPAAGSVIPLPRFAPIPAAEAGLRIQHGEYLPGLPHEKQGVTDAPRGLDNYPPDIVNHWLALPPEVKRNQTPADIKEWAAQVTASKIAQLGPEAPPAGQLPPAPAAGAGKAPTRPDAGGLAPPARTQAGETPAQGPGEVKPKGRNNLSLSNFPDPADGVPDLLSAIAATGGAPGPRKGATGGEYDGYTSAFGQGAARNLRRQGGGSIDTWLPELAAHGYDFHGDLNAFYTAVERAVANRTKTKARVEQMKYEGRGDTALYGNAGRKPHLKAGAPTSSDTLNVGDTFSVRGEKFTVKEAHEDGSVTVEDGRRFTIAAGTDIYPDKGQIVKAAVDTDFLPPEEAVHQDQLPGPPFGEAASGPTTPEPPRPPNPGELIGADEGGFALQGQDAPDLSGELDRQAAIEEAKAEQERRQGRLFGMGGTPARARAAAPLRVPAPIAATSAPAVGPIGTWLAARTLGFKQVFAPASMGADARAVANVLRENLARNALALARADHALRSWRAEFDRTPVPPQWKFTAGQPLPHNYAVIDELERGRANLPARYQALAAAFEPELAWRIAEIQKYSPQALQHLIENYFPHLWKDPERAGDVMAQLATRLFAGRKEFLRQRTLETTAAGLEAGLVPISDNPVDLLLAKMHSLDKFILALRSQHEWKATGAMKFKYILEAMPPGWARVDDPSFIVQRPPIVTVKEAVDHFQRAKLGEMLQWLGVSYERVASLGGKRWAEAQERPAEIRARIGASEDILWHELGHQLDFKFPDLRAAFSFAGKSPEAEQLRRLVDLNWEGRNKADVSKSHQKYLRRSEEKIAETIRARMHAPELLRQTAPAVDAKLDAWLDRHPEVRQRLEAIKPRLRLDSESTEQRLGGVLQLGHWIMPEGAAQVVKNHLSPSLSRFAAYSTFRAGSNILNAAQLGLSAFHLGFTSVDAAVSRLAVAIQDALKYGEPVRAARTAASVPLAPVTNFLAGRRILREALTPGTDPAMAEMVRALEQAGGRVGQDAFWKTEFTKRLVRATHLTIAQIRAGQTAGAIASGTAAALQAPLALIEQLMRPIIEYVVPRQKLGVFADLARRELQRLGPGAAPAKVREAMRKAWDSVDNRMGQFVYDNLFYNRTAKDLLGVSFRAYGWQLGKYRELAGAAADTAKAGANAARGKPVDVTTRMAYAVALPVLVGIIGALIQKLFTGDRPKDTRDLFQPRTGEMDVNGNPTRLNPPSYVKDLMAYGRHPVTSFAHSLNPAFSTLYDLSQNKDFYGTQIIGPDDTLGRKTADALEWLAKQATPFAVTGVQQMHQNDAPAWKWAAPFFGFTPVPQQQTMTPAQALASEMMASSMPVGARTRAQADHAQAIADLVREFRQGNTLQASAGLARGIQAGSITAAEAHNLIERLKYTPLQFQVTHMDAAAAMRVWRVADQTERQTLLGLVAAKVDASQTATQGDKAAWAAEIRSP